MDADSRDVEHETLLDLAGRAEFAARAHDHETLVATTRFLLTALAMHLDDEREERCPVDDKVGQHKARYEQEVIEEFVNLVHAATTLSKADCHCERLARRAMLRLRHQILVEASA